MGNVSTKASIINPKAQYTPLPRSIAF